MESFLWLPWRLPHINELIEGRGVVYKARYGKGKKPVKNRMAQSNAYHAMKKQWCESIGLTARARGFVVHPGCWAFTFLFVEQNVRRDPDNIAGGAVKFIFDGLRLAKLLDDDGWASVGSLYYEFTTPKLSPGLTVPGVLVAYGGQQVTKEALIEQAKVMSHAERFHRDVRRAGSDRGDSQVGREAAAGEAQGGDGVHSGGAPEGGLG